MKITHRLGVVGKAGHYQARAGQGLFLGGGLGDQRLDLGAVVGVPAHRAVAVERLGHHAFTQAEVFDEAPRQFLVAAVARY